MKSLFAALLLAALPALTFALNAPSGLTASANPDGSVTLAWSAVSGAQGYNAWQAASCPALPTVTAGASSSAIGGGSLPPGTSYTVPAASVAPGACWEVNAWTCASSPCPESGPSNQAQVPASQLTGVATLSWSAPKLHTDGTPITGALTYDVYAGAQGGALARVHTALAALTDTITGLQVGTVECFDLVANEAGGGSSAQFVPVCSAVPKPTLTPNAPGNVHVTITVTAP